LSIALPNTFPVDIHVLQIQQHRLVIEDEPSDNILVAQVRNKLRDASADVSPFAIGSHGATHVQIEEHCIVQGFNLEIRVVLLMKENRRHVLSLNSHHRLFLLDAEPHSDFGEDFFNVSVVDVVVFSILTAHLSQRLHLSASLLGSIDSDEDDLQGTDTDQLPNHVHNLQTVLQGCFGAAVIAIRENHMHEVPVASCSQFLKNPINFEHEIAAQHQRISEGGSSFRGDVGQKVRQLGISCEFEAALGHGDSGEVGLGFLFGLSHQ